MEVPGDLYESLALGKLLYHPGSLPTRITNSRFVRVIPVSSNDRCAFTPFGVRVPVSPDEREVDQWVEWLAVAALGGGGMSADEWVMRKAGEEAAEMDRERSGDGEEEKAANEWVVRKAGDEAAEMDQERRGEGEGGKAGSYAVGRESDRVGTKIDGKVRGDTEGGGRRGEMDEEREGKGEAVGGEGMARGVGGKLSESKAKDEKRSESEAKDFKSGHHEMEETKTRVEDEVMSNQDDVKADGKISQVDTNIPPKRAKIIEQPARLRGAAGLTAAEDVQPPVKKSTTTIAVRFADGITPPQTRQVDVSTKFADLLASLPNKPTALVLSYPRKRFTLEEHGQATMLDLGLDSNPSFSVVLAAARPLMGAGHNARSPLVSLLAVFTLVWNWIMRTFSSFFTAKNGNARPPIAPPPTRQLRPQQIAATETKKDAKKSNEYWNGDSTVFQGPPDKDDDQDE